MLHSFVIIAGVVGAKHSENILWEIPIINRSNASPLLRPYRSQE
ncbi:MAG: hypothetical protein ACKO2Z_04050 [Sphaerospermopsis kisseleviana]